MTREYRTLPAPARPKVAAPDPEPGRPAGWLAHVLATGGIRAKLKVDQPGDAYEQEADQLADRVMGGRSGAPSPSPAAPCCSGCASGGGCADDVKRTSVDGSIGGGGAELGSDAEARIRSGGAGQPLPEATRSFFEERFGRDLGNVRVHTGPDAAQLSEGINAHAFTRGNHVWLGSGTEPEPSHTMAHELAHVVQQSGPNDEPGPESDVVRRFAPYWEPATWSGPEEHREILPKMSKQGRVFAEAPVPNAWKPTRYTSDIKADYGKKGRADLYDASTTIGVYFFAPQVPRALLRTGLQFGGSPKGLPDPAPIPGPLQSIHRVDQAPPSVTVGDLKPSHGTLEAQEGTAQVEAYLDGFRLASDEVNEASAAGNVLPAGATWSPSRHKLSPAAYDSMTPPDYKHPATAQAPRPVVLKQDGKPVRPFQKSQARLVVSPDPVNAGIVNYTWVEDKPTPIRQAPRIAAIAGAVSEKIVKPLKEAPDKVARKTKRITSRLGRPTGNVQRNLTDPFELGVWRENRRKIRDDVRALRGSADVRDAKTAALLLEEREAAVKATGLPLEPLPRETQETGGAYDRIEFWTSTPAGFFGTLRRIFGRTFVRVADAYERMRKRFTEWLRRTQPTGGGGGLAGAAVKVLFKLLKMAGQMIVHRTMDVLRDSLVQGVAKKLMALVPEESGAALRTKVEEAQQLHAELTERARLTAESVVESVLPGYKEYADRIQKVMEIVGDITRIITLVRWGARAIACVSPPALGCLWGLLGAVLEEMAALVINTCWFQRKIAPFVAKLRFIREELPRGLAKKIIEAIRGMLPERLHDVFADVSATPPEGGEIPCDDSEPARRQPTDDEIAVADLQERLGDEKFDALLALLMNRGVPDGVPLTRARCEELGRLVDSLSTQDLKRLAAGQGEMPVPLATVVGRLKGATDRSPLEPERGEPVVTVEIEEDFESPEYETTVVGTGPGGGAGDGDGDVQSANAQAAGETSGNRVKNWTVKVVRVHGRLVRGEKVYIDIRMTSTGGGPRRTRNLNRLETTVVDVAASEENPGVHEAYLEVTRDQKFVFGRGEVYGYPEQKEFVHKFKPAAAK